MELREKVTSIQQELSLSIEDHSVEDCNAVPNLNFDDPIEKNSDSISSKKIPVRIDTPQRTIKNNEKKMKKDKI